MSDVFVSYAHQDYERAKILQRRLQSEGWDVFLDDDLKSGEPSISKLNDKLAEVKCVLVLWSRRSAKSKFCYDEADTGLAGGRLVAARIDTIPPRELPLGFRTIQVEDLSTWDGATHVPGVSKLIARIDGILRAPTGTWRALRPVEVDIGEDENSLSVSALDEDRKAILDQIGPNQDAHRAVERGYHWLKVAHETAKHDTDDHAPQQAYLAAAESFGEAIHLLDAETEQRIGRRGRPVSFFLKLERANGLAFSSPDTGFLISGTEEQDKAKRNYEKAIVLYEELLAEFPQDPAVFLRLGQAYARTRTNRSRLEKAVEYLNNALKYAETDEYVQKKHWAFTIQAPLLIGLCCWRLSALPGREEAERIKLLDDAIRYTKDLIRQPGEEHSEKERDLLHSACGNLLFFLAERARQTGEVSSEARNQIKWHLELICTEPLKTFARRQIRSVDNVLYAAMAVEDWELIAEYAELNYEELERIAKRRREARSLPEATELKVLDEIEVEMFFRARDMHFLSQMRKSAPRLWPGLG